MNLRQIEIFHAVYTNGSVSAAARALHVSQPSVSRILRHTETKLGFLLFRRDQNRLIATDQAHVLFREAEQVYRRIGCFKQVAKNIRVGGEDSLRIAVLPSLGLGLTPKAVARLTKLHPHVAADIQTLHHDEMLKSLHERDVELALGFEPPIDPSAAHLRIGDGELVVVYRRGAIHTAAERFNLRILEGQRFIGLAKSGPIGALFSREVERRSICLNEAISARTFFIAAGLVREGAGIAVIDQFTAAALVGTDLEYRKIEPALSFGVYCIFPKDRPLSRIAKLFVDLLSQQLRLTSPLIDAGEIRAPRSADRHVAAA